MSGSLRRSSFEAQSRLVEEHHRAQVLSPAERPPGWTPSVCIACHDTTGGVSRTTELPVVRVEANDDGSFTAVTHHWPDHAPKPSSFAPAHKPRAGFAQERQSGLVVHIRCETQSGMLHGTTSLPVDRITLESNGVLRVQTPYFPKHIPQESLASAPGSAFSSGGPAAF